ncbi:hypothetical protein PIB30_090582 [Stylosanthes scabra]|uniref:Uncharacterized protein n=1 Tax=Stylosanthes scabra TaxID=79078 RepID=A0ABU6ZSX8_9FABA|nr:hypothetical protein [Stylosanthes scabra]
MGFGGVFTHRSGLCVDMPYLGCWAWRRVEVSTHMRSVGRICVENRGVFGLGDGWQGKLGLWLARICVGVTHMRGEPEPGSQGLGSPVMSFHAYTCPEPSNIPVETPLYPIRLSCA